MKRSLPFLVDGWWFVVCCLIFFFVIQPLTAYHLPVTSSAFAQNDIPNEVILDIDAEVTVKLSIVTLSCGGTLVLESPEKKTIFSFPEDVSGSVFSLGTFTKDTELVFSINPNPPCASGPFYSGKPGYFAVIKVTPLYWYIDWGISEVPASIGFKLYFTPIEITQPQHHPAVFIHGLGGRPEDWTTGNKRVYFDTLKTEPYNYPEDYLAAYAYADADGNPATYDYQGDVTKISADLENYVNELSARHLANGGDGKVDLVGFSLGGLVARQYLNTHVSNHKIRRVITIGSPHEGSYLLKPEAWFDKFPIGGKYIKQAINTFFNTVFNTFRDGGNQPLNLNSMAVQQVVPGNSFLQWLNNLLFVPTDPEYNALYGNIDAELRQRIFFFELKKRFELGDGLILKDSATGIPVESLQTFEFSDSPLLSMQVKVAKTAAGGYEYVLDIPSIGDYRVYHSNLVVHPDVVQKVIELLTQD